MRRGFAVALAIAATSLMPLVAQEKPAPAAGQGGASSAAPQIPLKVQLTLSRFVGDKKVSSVPYMLGVLTNAQKTSLRMGVQVPVIATMFGSKTEGGAIAIPQSSYTYRDIGTSIDCQAQNAGNGVFNLVITVEDSAIHLDRSAGSAEDKKIMREVPAFRSFRASFAMVLHDGQSMQYASATDPVSGEVMKVDVTLSVAK
jgi:Flp pilus assembly secretin CpaC